MLSKINIWMILVLFINMIHSLRIISLKPGGLKGFYMFGVCNYIKSHYDLSNTVFYGSSAGAWNALYLSNQKINIYPKNPIKLEKDPYELFLEKMDISHCKNMQDIELLLKNFYMTQYDIEDFDLTHMNICIGSVHRFHLRKHIINDFMDLEDALNCCMASSHIPYVTNNKPFYPYRNMNCVDGGFFAFPHPGHIKPDIVIYPEMWKNKEIDQISQMRSLKIPELIYQGYLDADMHKYELDEALL